MKKMMNASLGLNVFFIVVIIVLSFQVRNVGIKRKAEANRIMDNAEKLLDESQALSLAAAEISKSNEKMLLDLQNSITNQPVQKTREAVSVSTTKSSNEPEKKYTAADDAVYVKAINDLKTTGLIISMNEESHTIVVEPSIWSAIDYQKKEMAVSVVGAHFEYQSGYSSVSVLDRYTNKKLAAFGVFGFKVY